KGHVLLEDLPGMGKTTLSQALAQVLGLDYHRIQFTSDLLPADILGVSVYDTKRGDFQFRKGPLFAQVILADEINRATPKAQGALLEAMEEYQVTVDGESFLLPKPFLVIATQNPHTQMGTFPLPEAQLDRFLMRLTLGYPDPTAEREIILGKDRRALLREIPPVLSVADIFKLQLAVREVHLSDPILDYVQRLVHFTRTDPSFVYGLSPRGTLGLVHCAQSWAYLHGRHHVVPEDVQAILPSVVEHRVAGCVDHSGHEGVSLSQKLLSEVDVVK
ncbi:MAG: AAA family ATPase, partial [Gammaproteobacteria bacterium]